MRIRVAPRCSAVLCSGLLRSGGLRFASSEGEGEEREGEASQLLARSMQHVGACGWSLRGGRRGWAADGWMARRCEWVRVGVWVGWVTGDREGGRR